MKVIAIQASPNEDGLTATAARAALYGAQQTGAETELIHLRQLEIGACLACQQGWGICRTENRCIVEDDYQDLRARLYEAGALVIATPVYFGDIAEAAKSFLDRLRRCEWGMGEASRLPGMPVMLISAAGGSGGGVVTALAALERYVQIIGMPIFDVACLTQRSRGHKLIMLEQAGAGLAQMAVG